MPSRPKRLRERVRIRQRMAAVCSGLGTREIAGEIGVDRARNMRGGVLARAPVEIVELGAAVDDRERRIVEV